jgi:5-methylcytosine-specific restriction endonuclease McrA
VGPRPRVAPLAAERFALQVTIGRGTYDKLCHAQALLGRANPSGELEGVLDRALEALIATLERRKFGAARGTRRRTPQPSKSLRHVPIHVRRTVYTRDQGQCTFVSESGQRCPARTRLEFDHIEPVACGGRATVDNLRLRCRAHNQLEAECAFGAGFMSRKRHEARATRAARGTVAAAERPTAASGRTRTTERTQAAAEVIPYLRHLGFRADESLRAAALCEAMPGASLEERVRVAIRSLGDRPRAPVAAAPSCASAMRAP